MKLLGHLSQVGLPVVALSEEGSTLSSRTQKYQTWSCNNLWTEKQGYQIPVANVVVGSPSPLLQVFNVKSITATQIENIVNGGISLLPIITAILADSFLLGSFSVVAISSCFSLLGLILLTLTASISSLRPPPCETISSLCQAPTGVQFTTLYAAIALASIGPRAIRFTLETIGANQLDKPQYQDGFFNRFFLILYGACVEEDIPLSSKTEDYYHGKDGTNVMLPAAPSQSLRFLNRASLKSEGDIQSNGLIAKP
ncbi:hypothetical protein SLE2022_284870 [Rubroshorea leprosula]